MLHSQASGSGISGSTDNNTENLGVKQLFKAGVWNCHRGIEDAANLDIVLRVAQKRKLDILSIPEEAKTGYGKLILSDGYVVYWTGPSAGERRQRGVALLLSPRASMAVIACTPASSRILHAQCSLIVIVPLILLRFMQQPIHLHAVLIRRLGSKRI